MKEPAGTVIAVARLSAHEQNPETAQISQRLRSLMARAEVTMGVLLKAAGRITCSRR